MYTSLIDASMFDGPKADLLVTVTGVISLVLIVAGASIIIKILWNKGG